MIFALPKYQQTDDMNTWRYRWTRRN